MKIWTILVVLVVTVLIHGFFLSVGFGDSTPFLPYSLEGWIEFIIRCILAFLLLYYLNKSKK